MQLLLITIIFIDILAWGEIDILVPSFPNIQDEFNISTFTVELLLSINLLSHCITTLFVGSVMDFWEKRKVMIASLIIFIFGSILSYYSTEYKFLLMGRILQGIGISGPVIMCNVLISDYYPITEQQQLLGLVNGVSTIVLIFAPLLGSYVNIFFGWRANFFVLLIAGIITLILSYLYIPKKAINPKTVANAEGYLEILFSKKVILYIFTINLFILPYWTFLGMAPILYVKGLGISLKSYSIYQCSLAVSFSVLSFAFSYLIKRIGSRKCFYISTISLICFIILTIFIIKFAISSPLLIILAVHLLTIGTIFTYNILTPLSLEILPNSKNKVSAFTTFSKLFLVSITLQIVSHFYKGNFAPLGIAMIISILISLYLYYKLLKEPKLPIERIENNKN